MKNHVANLKTILIDDELDARFNLRLMLRQFPEMNIVAEANDVPSGIAAIKIHQPDLIFLDIQMGEKTGFDLLEHFPAPDFQVIFCTGFDQFALQAIKKNALDYLLKPVDPDELAAAVQKALKNKVERTPPRLTFQVSGEVWFVEMEKVSQIESDGMYSTIKLTDGRQCVQVRSLREFEEILPPGNFVRTHQSHLVNLNFVEKFLPETGFLKMKNGSEIPVARRRRTDILLALGLN